MTGKGALVRCYSRSPRMPRSIRWITLTQRLTCECPGKAASGRPSTNWPIVAGAHKMGSKETAFEAHT